MYDIVWGTDETICIDLQAGSRIQVHNGYTQVVDGYLRLIADTTEPSSEAPFQVNTLNNLSLNKLVRRN